MRKQIKKREIKEKLIFWRAFLIVSFIFLINIGVYLSDYGGAKKVTGFSIDDISFGSTIIELYNSIPVTTRIFIALQWGLLLLVLIFVYIKDRKIKVMKNELDKIDLEKASRNSKTDLDILYNILKEKKQLKISTLTRLFDVDEDIIIDWCKTLELSNLVTIESAAAGGPIVRIVEGASFR